MKATRFYFHYYRQYKCMSVHWRGTCYRADDINCRVPVETKWRKSQPNLVLQGFAKSVEVVDGVATIK